MQNRYTASGMTSKHVQKSCPPDRERHRWVLDSALTCTFNLLVLSDLKILILPNFMVLSLLITKPPGNEFLFLFTVVNTLQSHLCTSCHDCEGQSYQSNDCTLATSHDSTRGWLGSSQLPGSCFVSLSSPRLQSASSLSMMLFSGFYPSPELCKYRLVYETLTKQLHSVETHHHPNPTLVLS